MKRLCGYIGAYTKHFGNGRGEGIYSFSLNPEDGSLENPRLAIDTPNPSYLALSASKEYLYAVNELDEWNGSPGGAVSAFAVGENGGLAYVNRQPSGGKSPCHIALLEGSAPRGGLAVVSNYYSGNIALFPLAENGALKKACGVTQFTGTGPNRERQEAPHAHSFFFTPGGGYGFACDLGTDRIMPYRFDAPFPVPLPPSYAGPGAGPRHGVFHPGGKWAYCANELDSTVDVFAFTGRPEELLRKGQTLSTLPAGALGGNTASAIKLSPDARFLYVSNRGHDSIAVLRVLETGLLEAVAVVPSGGKTPRDFAIDSSGHFLLVCHQDSDNLAVFRIEKETGIPRPLRTYPLPSGVCVIFGPLV